MFHFLVEFSVWLPSLRPLDIRPPEVLQNNPKNDDCAGILTRRSSQLSATEWPNKMLPYSRHGHTQVCRFCTAPPRHRIIGAPSLIGPGSCPRQRYGVAPDRRTQQGNKTRVALADGPKVQSTICAGSRKSRTMHRGRKSHTWYNSTRGHNRQQGHVTAN